MESCRSDQSIQYNQRVPQSHQEWKSYQALQRAIRLGQKEEAKRLLDENVPVNVHSNYSNSYSLTTPLHLAIHLGCLDLIKMLLDRGALISFQDGTFETPLMLSVRLRKYSITDILLTVDPIESFERHSYRLNHLHIACLRNNIGVVKKLIALGAGVNEAVSKNPLHWKEYTPLHFAVEAHGVEIVKLLLDNDADVMRKNKDSMTPLHLANEMRNDEIIDILLEAHMFKLGNPSDKHGLSHFHIACTRNNVNVVEHFLKQGAHIDSAVTKICDKWSHYEPLAYAIHYECPEVVELLLKLGASTWNFRLEEDYVQLAYEIGNEKIIKLLLLNSKTVKSWKWQLSSVLSRFQRACAAKDFITMERLLLNATENFHPDLNLPLMNGSTPLHFLVEDVSKEMIAVFRKFGADVSIKDASGLTPLHILFKKAGDLNYRDELISSELFDLEKNPSDRQGLTHFHIACATKNVRLMEAFLGNGSVNIDDAVSAGSLRWSGYTAMHFAVESQHLSAIDLLLKNGAKVSVENGKGFTPFDIAILYLNEDLSREVIESNRFDVVQKMLVEGEKSNIHFDKRGFSLLHVLLITKAELDYAQFSSYIEKLPGGINQTINFPRSEYHGCTTLHFAMKANNFEVAKWLIERGANIHLKNSRGFSPLYDEIKSSGSYRILEKNPEMLCVPGNPFADCGYSYFHIGCLLDNREIMEYYVASGVDVNVRQRIGLDGHCKARTPLHAVVHNPGRNAVDTVKFLLEHGADVTARDAYLNTPLNYVDSQMSEGMVELLLTHGADVNAQNFRGNTPLDSACYNCMSSKIIALLLDYGADINIENNEGDTPLTRACDILMNAGVSRDEMLLTLLRHTKKLILLGLYVSQKNEEKAAEFFEHYTVSTFDQLKFEDECFQEIRAMRDLRINKYTTLYSVISKSLNEMAHLSQNAAFLEIINSNEFASNFPIYGYLIKLQFERGLVRKPLLEKCKQASNFLAKLSKESVEKILEYLDNDDLKNIIKCEKMTCNV